MLERKIEAVLKEWKNDKNHKPLIIKGCRQCGKTHSVLKFSHENYDNVVYLNFFENKAYCTAFEGSLKVDDIIMILSVLVDSDVRFVPYQTVIILDEIQYCPEARTALKFFKLDGRYDIIATGSLLGVSGYNDRQPISIPVGYEHKIDMYPMDFEEFLWANGISRDVIHLLNKCIEEEKPVPQAIHQRMKELLLQYTIVGGMPEVVQKFVDTKLLNEVYALQQDIVEAYKDDMIKYADKKDKSKIIECFNSIPRQLSKENKKFQYSTIKKGSTASKYEGSLQWIEDAGIIQRCFNLTVPELPLDGNAMNDVFKIYMQDCGLLVSMFDREIQLDILQGNLLTYKGAIFENLIADIFSKKKRKLYYFHKDSGLEIDFVIRYKNLATLVEVKATSGKSKSLNTVLSQYTRYHVNQAIKFGLDYNVGKNYNILTLPLYMAFLI